MSFKDMIKEVEDAAEGMVLPKETDEVAHELKESVTEKVHEIEDAVDEMLHLEKNDLGADLSKMAHEIEDAAGSMLGVDHDAVSEGIGEKVGHLVKEVEDASEVMIPGDKPKK